jgi:hypothetical protein
MNYLQDILQNLHDTGLSTAIREQGFWFPLIECTHVLSIGLVVGSIALVDLRLIGWTWTSRMPFQVIRETVPLTWGAFISAITTGSLLFASNPLVYVANLSFQLKAAFLLLAGLNMAVFNIVTLPAIRHLPSDAPLPTACRISGYLSLCLWIAIVASARVIGFTMNSFG